MADYTIRPAREEDVPRLREIEALCFTDPWSGESIRSSLASPLYYAHVAPAEGAVTAYLIAQLVSGEGELLRVAVMPEARSASRRSSRRRGR